MIQKFGQLGRRKFLIYASAALGASILLKGCAAPGNDDNDNDNGDNDNGNDDNDNDNGDNDSNEEGNRTINTKSIARKLYKNEINKG